MNETTVRYVLEHEMDDISGLLLKKAPEGVDIAKAVDAIEARRRMKTKCPVWYGHPGIEYPGRLCVEQCSSEAAAVYKRQFVDGDTVADLTAGLGVDSWSFSAVAAKVVSFERNEALCRAQINNFSLLKAKNIVVTNAEFQNISQLLDILGTERSKLCLIYLDPARRAVSGKKVHAFEDCSPDITSLIAPLLSICPKVLVKSSPMLDLKAVSGTFPQISRIDVVAVDGECKETLALFERGFNGQAEIRAVNLGKDGKTISSFISTLSNEESSPVKFCDSISKYIYQPDKSILKAGMFKQCSAVFGLEKLDASTHLYTSERIVNGFPGKVYEVIEVCDFNKRVFGYIRQHHPKAELVCHNFPLDTASLRRRLGIAEGGPERIFACTAASKRILVVCKPAKSLSLQNE